MQILLQGGLNPELPITYYEDLFRWMKASFPLAMVMSKNLTVRGITVGSVANLDAMCRAIELNGYRPVIDQIFDLDHAHEAVATMKKQGHFGKIAIRIADA